MAFYSLSWYVYSRRYYIDSLFGPSDRNGQGTDALASDAAINDHIAMVPTVIPCKEKSGSTNAERLWLRVLLRRRLTDSLSKFVK